MTLILTAEELPKYCSVSIDEATLTNANIIVQNVIGDLSKQSTVEEHVHFGKFKHPKLKHVQPFVPLISIDKVQTVTRTPFGLSKEEIPLETVFVGEEGYIHCMGMGSLANMLYGVRPSFFLIDYTWGYEEFPDDLKFAVSAVAQNIAKRGTYGLKSLSDFDVKLAFVDDSIVTNDIRNMLQKYRGV